MKTFKKILKISGVVLLLSLILAVLFFHRSSAIQSNDKMLFAINKSGHNFEIFERDFRGVKYRYVISEDFDVQNPTILFIHGAIGSITTFTNYAKTFDNGSVNLVILDRPNYGKPFNPNYTHTIDFEADLVNDLLESYRSEINNIAVGYSYGGPIALLAHSKSAYDSVVLISPAIDPENEFVPLAVNFYKYRLTRPLVPLVWREASKEKLGHVEDLKRHVDTWENIKGNIIHVHGTKDWIAPYENAKFLKRIILPEYYNLISIEGGGHGALWSQYLFISNIIKEQLA